MTQATSGNFYLMLMRDVPNTQRAKHFPAHMEAMLPIFKGGFAVAGGALLQNDAKSTDADVSDKMIGSAMFVRANSAEEVWDNIRKDPFYTTGEVWDHSTIEVIPVFLAALPEAK